MMSFAMKSAAGEVHEVFGTNIVPAFPEGTKIAGLAVNGKWFPLDLVSEGHDMSVDFGRIRKSFAEGAPKVAPIGGRYGVFRTEQRDLVPA